jgi:hypothetical protein
MEHQVRFFPRRGGYRTHRSKHSSYRFIKQSPTDCVIETFSDPFLLLDDPIP